MSRFLYPHTISIHRPQGTTAAGGAQAYGGQAKPKLTLLFKAVRCNIQARRSGRENPTGTPSDVKSAEWDIFIPRGVISKGQVANRDICIDETGRRYQVTSDYVPGLGARLTCDRLEA